MSNNPAEASPLLGTADLRPKRSQESIRSNASHETTPLLSRSDDAPRYDGDDHDQANSGPAAASLRSLGEGQSSPKKNGKRWPTFLAIAILGTAVVAIIICAFFAPAIMEQYAKESLVIEPTNLSIDKITTNGVTARVQANFRLDGSKVKNNAVRNIGRFGTWIAKEVESKEFNLEVYLPEYGNILVGTAAVPRVIVNIRNGITTPIDCLADLVPGDVEGLRQVANDWLEGRLGSIRVLGKAEVSLKSGLIPLGSQILTESLVFEGQSLYHSFASLYLGEKTLA